MTETSNIVPLVRFHFDNMCKHLPNMNKFCVWLSETKVISVHDHVFLKDDFYSLLSSVVIPVIDQPHSLIVLVGGDPTMSKKPNHQ